MIYNTSSARRFVVDADGLTADSLYVVLDGRKTMQELRGERSSNALPGCPISSATAAARHRHRCSRLPR
jgi:hypothetical protein